MVYSATAKAKGKGPKPRIEEDVSDNSDNDTEHHDGASEDDSGGPPCHSNPDCEEERTELMVVDDHLSSATLSFLI